MPDLRVERPRDVGTFLERAGAYLETREAEHNLIFAICSGLTAHPEIFGAAPLFAVVADDRGEVVGAAIQTPPRQLILSEAGAPDVTMALADALGPIDLPGVLGPTAAAAEFGRRWAGTRQGRSVEPGMRERIYRLTDVVPARPAPGAARIADARDRERLVEWLRAFSIEALGEPMDEAEIYADRWVVRLGGRAAWLWEVDGEVVSFSGISGPTPHGIRVGPVYTPPELRSRGYAGNVVAAASKAQLDAGRRFVFLFTDLANATSNHVYQAIGYEPVTDVDQWLFRSEAAAG